MKVTPTKLLHYGLLLVAGYIVYSWLVQEDQTDTFANHPRNKDKVKGGGHGYAKDARHVQYEEEDKLFQSSQNKHVKQNAKHQQTQHKEEHIKEQKDVKRMEVEKDVKRMEVEKDVKRMKDEKDVKRMKDEKDAKRTKQEEKEVKEMDVQKNRKKVTERIKEEEEIPEKTEEKPTKLKWKGKEKDEGKDLLKELNDAELKGDKDAVKNIHNLHDHIKGHVPKIKKHFGDEYDDLEMVEEKKKRRVQFFEEVRLRGSEEELPEDAHIHEMQDTFAYVTAVSSQTYKAAIFFVHSVQTNFPDAKIGLFDIGLQKGELAFLRSLCSVEVYPNIITAFPKHIHADMNEKIWRPVIIQLAAAKYGHYVYLDPMRGFKRKVYLKGHFALSRKGGAAMFGNFKSYSTAVVTHPDMYYFLAADVKKLYKLQHMEITMMIVHNSDSLRHYFLRWLAGCTYEPYCIAPPGAQRKCNMNLYPKSKKYADCHRFDESAINILLASWHKYDVDHYAAEDHVTTYYGGFDMSLDVKKCNANPVKEGL